LVEEVRKLDGKGIVDEGHDLALGVLGTFGFPAVETTKQMLRQADAILAFGVDTIKPFLTDALDVQQRAFIQCEAECSALAHEYHRARTLLGPLDAIADGLRDRICQREVSAAFAALMQPHTAYLATYWPTDVLEQDSAFAHPLMFLQQLNRHLDARCTIALDTGAHTLWAAQVLQLRHRQRVLVSSRLGTMGFSSLLVGCASVPKLSAAS
jgi:pyruvate oxidase